MSAIACNKKSKLPANPQISFLDLKAETFHSLDSINSNALATITYANKDGGIFTNYSAVFLPVNTSFSSIEIPIPAPPITQPKVELERGTINFLITESQLPALPIGTNALSVVYKLYLKGAINSDTILLPPIEIVP